MVDGRLIGAARLQIAIPDKLHIGGFGRGPDLLFGLYRLTLRVRTAAENE
jgi:hypothetical protein